MATFFVDSNASGSNNGTSWTDAWTSTTSITGLAAATTDFIRIAHNHSETITGGGQFPSGIGSDLDSRNIMVSTDPADDSYRRGASLTFSTASPIFRNGHVYRGVDFTFSVDVEDDADDEEPVLWEDCTFTFNGAVSFVPNDENNYWQFREGCIFDRDTSQVFFETCEGRFEINGGVFTGTGTAGIMSGSTLDPSNWLLENCDFSALGYTFLIEHGNSSHYYLLARCRLNASGDIVDVADSDYRVLAGIDLHACDSGDITNPIVRNEKYDPRGHTKVDAAVYRDIGAFDGTTNYSWAITAENTSNTIKAWAGTVTPWISRWIDGAAPVTFSLHAAHDAVGAGTAGALETDQFWLEIEGPDNGSPANAQGYFFSGRPEQGDTIADVSADGSSTWTGTGVGTKQVLSHTYTPSYGGFVRMRAHFAPDSASDEVVHLDPKIELS